MRYFIIDLDAKITCNASGKSLNKAPLLHVARTLNDYEMFFVTDGVLNIKQTEESRVTAGEVLFHRKDMFQAGTEAAPCTFYWLHFDNGTRVAENESELRDMLAENGDGVYFAERFRLTDTERITLMLTELNCYAAESGGETVRRYLLKALLAEVARQYALSTTEEKKDKRFSDLLASLKYYVYGEISLAKIADIYGYNPKYLARLFSEKTGRTFTCYVTEKRIDKAKELLVSEYSSVKEIAYRIGYNDEYYFMRVFKKQTGMTPGEYRKTFRSVIYT